MCWPPVFPKPDPAPLPLPLLKKPDEGVTVEFPKPGAAGMSMIGMEIGRSPPVPTISINGCMPASPIARLISGRTIDMFGKVIELTSTILLKNNAEKVQVDTDSGESEAENGQGAK